MVESYQLIHQYLLKQFSIWCKLALVDNLPIKVKQTPNRTPISESLSAVDPTTGASRPISMQHNIINDLSDLQNRGRFVHDPEKNPWRMTKTIVPATSLTASMQKIRIDVIRAQGMTGSTGQCEVIPGTLGTVPVPSRFQRDALE